VCVREYVCVREREAVCESDRGRERERPPSPSITPAPADGECARGGERDRVCVTAITNHSTCDHRQCVCEREWVGESVREGERDRRHRAQHLPPLSTTPPMPADTLPPSTLLSPSSLHPQPSSPRHQPSLFHPPRVADRLCAPLHSRRERNNAEEVWVPLGKRVQGVECLSTNSVLRRGR